MSHVRQQIRERLITICGGLTTTTNHVYNTRLYALIPESNLPALLVYTQTEDAERELIAPSTYQRSLNVIVEGIAEGNSQVENTLDTIASEVEAVIGSDPGLNGLCVSISLTSTEIEFTSESEHPIGVIKLSFDCLYYTAANNSTISIT